MQRSEILGTGSCVPDNVVTNEDMTKLVRTSDEWIQQRSGVKERRYLRPGEGGPASLGADAVRRALNRAGVGLDDVDLLIYSTQNPEYFSPPSACFLQEKLGMDSNIPAFDVRNQCSGFLYGMEIADAYIRAGIYERVLLACCETHSPGLEYSDEGRHITVLFGDGAGAMVLGPSSSESASGIVSSEVHADGRRARQLWLEAGGGAARPRLGVENLDNRGLFPYMNGAAVFKKAVSGMVAAVKSQLEQNGLAISDIDYYFPHQANRRISETVGKFIGMDPERVDHSIERYGNCSSASIPIALDEAAREGRIHKGDLLLFSSFAAGFTWGAALVRF